MQTQENKTSLIWFRNNLRIHDNSSITKAITKGNKVIAIYCFDPRHFQISEFGFKKTEKYRARFLIESATNLKANLEKHHIPLFVYLDKPENQIPKLVADHQVTDIFLQEEWTHEETFVFNQVKKQLSNNVQFTASFEQFLFHPEDIPFKIEQLPNIFTNFRKTVEKYVNVQPLSKHTIVNFQQPEFQNTTKIPTLNDLGLEDFNIHHKSAFPFSGGESAALNHMQHYIFNTQKLGVYKNTRNGLIGTDYSSKFSPWLANGCLSPKLIYHEIKRFENEYFSNQSTYWLIFELIWRDYFKYISLKYGNNIFKTEGILNKTYSWYKNKETIQHWIDGKTSEPFVNANMIELGKTGWMSNRGRQNVASYFAKHLKIDWRIGASYFESLLLDYDVHSNYGNWMYVSGVGNDPRDRKFDVKSQAERYDTNGKHQRLWLQNSLF
ncbi:DASH family cryptochrome [Aestuariibaculum suncheonense]|uniref:Cryptochrome DASH n=1 Tax=Aestuariibaculum suncheonense TaxID=1028745 RepID=A0A8J6UAE9_9FLAO|nr:DASH family cryptochrome [Aestuariibaculum suncheonense]MBD0835198.1 DASH family cryptochrome [Aestuariibaculum suncheonense]